MTNCRPNVKSYRDGNKREPRRAKLYRCVTRARIPAAIKLLARLRREIMQQRELGKRGRQRDVSRVARLRNTYIFVSSTNLNAGHWLSELFAKSLRNFTGLVIPPCLHYAAKVFAEIGIQARSTNYSCIRPWGNPSGEERRGRQSDCHMCTPWNAE